MYIKFDHFLFTLLHLITQFLVLKLECDIVFYNQIIIPRRKNVFLLSQSYDSFREKNPELIWYFKIL